MDGLEHTPFKLILKGKPVNKAVGLVSIMIVGRGPRDRAQLALMQRATRRWQVEKGNPE